MQNEECHVGIYIDTYWLMFCTSKEQKERYIYIVGKSVEGWEVTEKLS